MGKNSKIGWTDHTFNIVWGCAKVNEECKNCYAEAQSKRYGFDVWGPDKSRRILSRKYWKEPLKWNANAIVDNKRALVFCGSMCDWLEDHPTVNEERKKLFPLIKATPWLTWLLLTKRPENMRRLVGEKINTVTELPRNIMLGVSAGTQETYRQMWPRMAGIGHGLDIPTFVSLEPLLGPINLGVIYSYNSTVIMPDWIIIGGESGPKARPVEVRWMLDLVKQAKEHDVPIFVKQMGTDWAKKSIAHKDDPKGEVMELWPHPLQIQEYPANL